MDIVMMRKMPCPCIGILWKNKYQFTDLEFADDIALLSITDPGL